MGDKTKISWTDATINPFIGCTRIASGCQNCYAEAFAPRLARMGCERYEGMTEDHNGAPRWTGLTKFVPSELLKPLRWRRPRRIFLASMSDVFHWENTDEEIDRVFGMMWACEFLGKGDDAYPGHTFQVLSKRANRMRDYMQQDRREKWAYAAADLSNGGDRLWDQIAMSDHVHPRIWLGVSASTQKEVDENAALLVDTPAAVRFMSLEPLLEGVDLNEWVWPLCRETREVHDATCIGGMACNEVGIDWFIAGGESGNKARPCDIGWLQRVVQQCNDAGTACFVKQLGERATEACGHGYRHGAPRLSGEERCPECWERGTKPYPTVSKTGANPVEWPWALQMQQFPGTPLAPTPVSE